MGRGGKRSAYMMSRTAPDREGFDVCLRASCVTVMTEGMGQRGGGGGGGGSSNSREIISAVFALATRDATSASGFIVAKKV